jgi:TonB family protein
MNLGRFVSPRRHEAHEGMTAENAEKDSLTSRRTNSMPLKSKSRGLNLTAWLLARERFSAYGSAFAAAIPSCASCLRGELLLALALTTMACGAPPEEDIEPPQVLTDSVPFIYPVDLWDHNVSGQTVLLVRVNATGQVDSVAVDIGSGYPEFDSAAVQGAWRLRFIAARQGERRVPMWTKVPVRFARDTTTEMGIGGP